MKKVVTVIYGGYGGICESNIKRDFRIILHTGIIFIKNSLLRGQIRCLNLTNSKVARLLEEYRPSFIHSKHQIIPLTRIRERTDFKSLLSLLIARKWV